MQLSHTSSVVAIETLESISETFGTKRLTCVRQRGKYKQKKKVSINLDKHLMLLARDDKVLLKFANIRSSCTHL